jgi:hypothetical protein
LAETDDWASRPGRRKPPSFILIHFCLKVRTRVVLKEGFATFLHAPARISS